ncbi:MAG: dihydroneopterin aldolase [Candidatus Wallbacteria bacterium]|nr:dihydroneopterin aldolase [Candidatus Wallbacteria bacterium]
MERIRLNKLEFYGYHGVFSEERKLGQKLLVSLDLQVDLSKACKSDRIEDTVDYTRIYETAKSVIQGSGSFNLLEHLAWQIAGSLLQGFENVKCLEVTVCKPSVPYPGIGSCEVTVRRER